MDTKQLRNNRASVSMEFMESAFYSNEMKWSLFDSNNPSIKIEPFIYLYYLLISFSLQTMIKFLSCKLKQLRCNRKHSFKKVVLNRLQRIDPQGYKKYSILIL